MKQALVVNLFAGPGTGKSTTAALTFGKLKANGVNSELVHEFAKDLTWERRSKALSFQPYIMGKQSYHIHRLLDEVDVIVTDSPILLGAVYKGGGCTPSFIDHLFELFRSWDTLNIFLERNAGIHPYVAAGRNQSESEAEAVDRQIFNLLTENAIPFYSVDVEKGEATADNICSLIQDRLSS